MPQMSPMLWFFLFLYFIFLMYLMIVLIYFFFYLSKKFSVLFCLLKHSVYKYKW